MFFINKYVVDEDFEGVMFCCSNSENKTNCKKKFIENNFKVNDSRWGDKQITVNFKNLNKKLNCTAVRVFEDWKFVNVS